MFTRQLSKTAKGLHAAADGQNTENRFTEIFTSPSSCPVPRAYFRARLRVISASPELFSPTPFVVKTYCFCTQSVIWTSVSDTTVFRYYLCRLRVRHKLSICICRASLTSPTPSSVFDRHLHRISFLCQGFRVLNRTSTVSVQTVCCTFRPSSFARKPCAAHNNPPKTQKQYAPR